MANWHTDLATRKTIADYVAIKNEALRHIEDARRSVDAAEKILNTVCSYMLPHTVRMPSEDECVRQINRGMWRKTFHLTGLTQLMDAQAIAELERSIDSECPDFTEENITATFLAQAQQADMMFRRGIVNVFFRLSPEYKTNKAEPFRIGPKFVMSYGCERSFGGGRRIRFGSEDRINDVDRVFCVIDKQPHSPATLQTAMNDAFRKCIDFENSYFRVKSFKNGNLHWTIKRLDLLDQVNLQIAQYYGENKLAEG